jgi:Lon protease-like protein
MPTLPLFPLGTVLLPGGSLPLQVFEARYVVMLHDLLNGDRADAGREFGVVALRRGHEVGVGAALDLHEIGCTAHIDTVAPIPATEGMRYVLTTTGARRFVLRGVAQSAGTPYLTGEVTFLDEPTGPIDQAAGLEGRVRAEVAAYRRAIGAPQLTLPEDRGALSYRAADAAILDTAVRQRLLEAPDTSARLRLVLDVLRRERLLVEKLGAVPRQGDVGGAGLN